MRIDIHCKGMTMTDSIKAHVEDKLAKIEKLIPGELDAQTFLNYDENVKGGHFSAEVTFRVWNHDLISKSDGEDLYKAVSESADAMLRQVRKLKEKREKKRKGGTSIRGMEDPESLVLNQQDDDDEEYFDEV